MNSAIEPLAPDEFERRLANVAFPYPFEETRFYRMITSERCPASFVQGYARSTRWGANLFCGALASLIERAPDAEARGLLMENLLEEEGVFLRDGVGLVVRPETRHPNLAARFLKACGGDPDEALAGDPPVSALSPGLTLLQEGRWLEAVAFLLVGQEHKFSDVCTLIFEALQARGLPNHALAFFAVHKTADKEHGEQAIALVRDRAVTRAQQEAALAAAGEGARCWLEAHGGRVRAAA